MADTTAQHIAARNDKELKERFIATAEQAQVPNAAQFVEMNMGRLVSTEVGGTTVTAVHAYATQVRTEALAQVPPPAGLNPAAVVDSQLAAAVQAVWAPEG